MSELLFRDVVKIYPYTPVKGLFGRKKAQEARERQRQMPYTTNEGVVAVQGFNLTVPAGEFLVLLGPSGCGKTTVLRMLAGLESVSGGSILMDGKDLEGVRPEDRDMAMIFQNYALYPEFTVYQNLAYPLQNQHMPREELDRRVRETAELLELTPYLQRRPQALSGGQKQRTAIGRALVRRPAVFLMDEPFSNLDVNLRRKLREELKTLHRKLGTTFIYVTHDQMEAFALGDRIVVMEQGIIRQVGSPRALYNRPENLYTASFLGAPPMNLIEGAVLRREGEGWTLEALGQRYPLPPGRFALTPGDADRPLILGVRPVHVSPGDAGPEAVVEYVDVIEAELQIHLRLGERELISVIPAATAGGPLRGTRLRLRLDPERFHLFDPETGERVG